MTPDEARRKIARSAHRYRAAVLEGEEFPLKDHESTAVRLFELVGNADNFFRGVRRSYVERGYRKAFGSASLGLIRFEKDGEPDVVLALDKRPRSL